ncbi:rCG46266 [Rattus norvegicus]|uniref:RCG46266 n=1 Tax=Rattus norvegicus TaxID=10116 RepID=A6IDM4_RAT|nr:rCG46266 [Rattus norvegicus]
MLLYQKELRQRILSRSQVFLFVSGKIFTQSSYIKVTKENHGHLASRGLARLGK